MKTLHILALAIAAALASTFAVAQTATPATDVKAAQRIDANGDGVIDRAEAAKMPRLAEKFDQLDANKDGKLSASERPQRMHGQRGGGKRGGYCRSGTSIARTRLQDSADQGRPWRRRAKHRLSV